MLIQLHDGQDGVLHMLEAACNHAGADNVRGLPGIVLEQGGTPAAWQDGIREQEACQVQQLPHIVAQAQMFDGEVHHPVGILPRQHGGAAYPQVFLAVFAQWRDHSALAQ